MTANRAWRTTYLSLLTPMCYDWLRLIIAQYIRKHCGERALCCTTSIRSYGLVHEYNIGSILRNTSRNSCWRTSNAAVRLRMLATSFACSGATCCFIAIAAFLVLFHISGSSWRQQNQLQCDLSVGGFAARCYMHKRGPCHRTVSVRQSVRLSYTFLYSVETNKRIFKFFSPSDSHTILVFCTKRRYGNILTGTALTRASNAGSVGKNRDSQPVTGFIACCQRFYRQVLHTQLSRTVASWWHSSLV